MILAGGKGSRMGEVGKLIPKFILPINGEIILLRTLRMIREAKASNRIIISTRQEFIDQIKSLVDEIDSEHGY
ncbi:NTP transferase domain-containing protein [Candidatus Collierbacteria bacterium]|nr:NTP transferase domain-containing protein [Candidatus Collierbacteria bacterium]